MKLTRTPGVGRTHKYNLNLTTDELIMLGSLIGAEFDGPEWKLSDRMFALFIREVDRLGKLKGESGATDRATGS